MRDTFRSDILALGRSPAQLAPPVGFDRTMRGEGGPNKMAPARGRAVNIEQSVHYYHVRNTGSPTHVHVSALPQVFCSFDGTVFLIRALCALVQAYEHRGWCVLNQSILSPVGRSTYFGRPFHCAKVVSRRPSSRARTSIRLLISTTPIGSAASKPHDQEGED
jgi:hypothetical protein